MRPGLQDAPIPSIVCYSFVPPWPMTAGGRPMLWGIVAVATAVALSALARSSRMAIPPHAVGATVAFPVLLGPSLISFQERYLLLPSAASALALAALLGAMKRRARIAALAVLLAAWCLSLGDQWLS